MFSFPGKKQDNTRIYLDHAATTPVRPEVFSMMKPFFSEQYGNPSSVHAEGVRANKAIEAAREKVARSLEVRPSDITFTSGGTESNNIALLGHIEYLIHEAEVAPKDIEIVSTTVEHPSIGKVLKWIEKHGVTVQYAPIDEEGRVIVHEFEKLLSHKTRLVSIAYVNSETGVVQDIGKIARTVHAFEKAHDGEILVHTDACQAPLWLPCELGRLGVDMLSLDAGKCYGPKGVGVLVHRTRARASLAPTTYGGSQESGLRPGTENVPLIVGCAEAIRLAQNAWQSRSETVAPLRDTMIDTLLKTIDGAVLNGSREHRVANNINISIPGIDAEFAVVKLDSEGIAASTRSACSGADGAGSSVVRTMSGAEARAKSTLRFTLGEDTTTSEINKTVAVLTAHVEMTRSFQKTLTHN